MGEQLDLEVELVAEVRLPALRAGLARVKDRPGVRVRDLPIAGRRTHLIWRKRRYRCAELRANSTETHPELPTPQRVSGRFRQSLLRSGYAEAAPARRHDPLPGRPRLRLAAAIANPSTGALRRAGSRSMRPTTAGRELATVVSDLDRPA